jgi:type II secretory pathway pseudopilin PulG
MRNKSAAGFSYIEVMIAIVILMVGLLALLSAISAAVVQARGQEQTLNARHIAATTMESIMSVKETDPERMGWDAVGNIGSNPDENDDPQGIFLVGMQPVLSDAGPDEVIGTADDTGTQVGGFRRQIVITDQCDPDRPSPGCNPPGDEPIKIRTVEITIEYYVGLALNRHVVSTVLTDYSVEE